MSNVFEHLDIEFEEINKLGIVEITMVKGERGSSGDYENLSHLPKINGVTVTGNKTSEDYGIDVIEDYNELSNLPKINNVTLTGNKTSADLSLASQSSMQNAELRLTVVENKIATIADPTDEQVAQAVDAWLDEHPEATTTVEDGAITFPKLANDVADLFINEEATAGDIVSFDDGARNIPVKDLTVEVNAVQDLHGYDNPWPGGGGKNLLDIDALLNAPNGNMDGYAFEHVLSITVEPNTNYTLSTSYAQDGNVLYFNGSTSSQHTVKADLPRTQMSDADGILHIGLFNRTGIEEFISKSVTVQLEKGSTATAYEPYSNICPISGWDEVNVTRTGKNLLASASLKNGVYISNTTGAEVSYGTWSASDYIPMQINTQYRLLRLNNGNYTPVVGSNLYWAAYDKNFNYVTGGIGDGIISSNSAIKYMRVSSSTAYLTKGVLALDSDKGDFVTEADYIDGNTYSVTWQTEAGTVYGGTLDVTTGVLTITWVADTFDGTENWSWFSAANQIYGNFLSHTAKYGNGTEVTYMCDTFKPVPNSQRSSNIGNYATLVSNGAGIGISTPATNATDAKAILASNPTTFVYELATPQVVQLTPTQVTTLLGQNNIWADCGDVAVIYRADTKKYIDGTIVDVPLAMIAPIENGTTASKAYAVGEYFILNGNQFCKAKTAIASGATFTLNTNYTVTTIGAELKALQ